ncbi:MAG: type II toxin-antitoxin system RelE/ParE family toxin [Bergeyella sp.]
MYKIIWSERAENEYYDTLIYWNYHNRSATYSEKLIAEVEEKETLISANPLLGKPHQYKNVRSIKILKHFSLIYQIIENEIFIVSFWDNRRNPEDLKL